MHAKLMSRTSRKWDVNSLCHITRHAIPYSLQIHKLLENGRKLERIHKKNSKQDTKKDLFKRKI